VTTLHDPHAAASAVTTAPESAPNLVSVDEIREAARIIDGITVRTPLLPFGPPVDGDPFGRPRAWLKPESLQPIGAFKFRGAYFILSTLSPEERAAGVVTHSSGNHAQGIARAAKLLGIHAVVVMPDNAPRIKVERVLADGAEIVFVGPDANERIRKADELAEEHGYVVIPSYDDRRLVQGQGTAGLEIMEDLERGGADAIAPPGSPFTILVPIGGGGLSSGIATAVKQLRPEGRIFGVEPDLAADTQESFREKRIVHWPAEQTARTIADGVRVTAVGEIPFQHLLRYLDGVLTVSEDEICRAMARAADHARLVLEPTGAVALAAWLFHEHELPRQGPVVILLTGGNVDPDVYASLIERGRGAENVGAPL
jgi:threonine dehydratase